jgi:hypothetical protein
MFDCLNQTWGDVQACAAMNPSSAYSGLGTDMCSYPTSQCHNPQSPVADGGGSAKPSAIPDWDTLLNSLTYWSAILSAKLEVGLAEECESTLKKLDEIEVPGKTGPLSASTLANALSKVVFKSGVGSTDLYMSLFPGKSAPTSGMAAMTVGEYFARHPGVSALAALGGNTIYFRNGAEASGATIMHELLHNLGLQDDEIMARLGISGPSVGITRRLWDDCFKPPVVLMY